MSTPPTKESPLVIEAPGLLGNDMDPDGDSFTALPVDAITSNGGTYSLIASGGFAYTPAPGFFGTDTFTYRITDGELTSEPATVTITVIGEGQSVQDGRTIGYWSNMNGLIDLTGSIDSGVLPEDLLLILADLPLRDANGDYFVISDYYDLQAFLLSADSKNGANMLSAQLPATVLNSYAGYVDPDACVSLSLVTSLSGRNLAALDGAGFTGDTYPLSDFIFAAVLYLDSTTYVEKRDKAYPEALEKIFDAVNNNYPIYVDCP